MAKDIETESFQAFPIGSRLPSYMVGERERETERETSICIQVRIVLLQKL